MIKFHKVRYKNFLSTGDTFTEIILDKKPTTLIIGANGSGKSTVLDALTFGLFGRAFRKVKREALINSINKKNAAVEVEFSIGRKQYKVIRTIKPNKFEIYLDGSLIHQDANVRDYQAILEQQILKLNYKSFTQVVVLGSSSFTPFMQLVTIDRRRIIEDILDIQIFSVMNDVLKQRYTALRHELNEIKTNIKIGEGKIKSQEDTMKRLEENRDEQITKLKSNIEKSDEQEAIYEGSIDAISRSVEKQQNLKEDEDDIRTKLQSVLVEEKKFESDRRQLLKEEKFYETNDECPTCKQDIEEGHKSHICEEIDKTVDELNTKLEERSTSIQEINTRLEEIAEINKEITKLQGWIQKEQMLITAGQRYRSQLDIELKDLETQEHTEEDTEKLDKYRKAFKQLEQMQAELVDDRHYFDLAEILLRDSGIKTKIIRQYLPIMNKLINKYLASMEFFVQFELDEEFNEQIKSRYRDTFTYSSFSEGEKMRIDLALLFTWRAIAKLKNSVNTNLLILDEVFDSSLDEGGTDEFLKILNTLGNDTNTFIISHKGDSMNEKFNNVIEFEKAQNFSRVV
jgi:DNA repair exonuclease SbcCD ATPase subunit